MIQYKLEKKHPIMVQDVFLTVATSWHCVCWGFRGVRISWYYDDNKLGYC